MKETFRLAALAVALLLSFFAAATPGYTAGMDCALKDGSACTNPGASSKCIYTDEICYYIYPCWCERNYVGTYQWRCGTTWIYEGCSV